MFKSFLTTLKPYNPILIESIEHAYSVCFENSIVAYHGTSNDFDEFSEYRPNFFTTNKKYASMYEKGNANKKIIEVILDIKNPFNTKNDNNAIDLYNNKFIPFAKIRNEIIPPIKLGELVSFIYADYLFAYLRKLNREIGISYDGIIVDEGFNNEESIVPLFNTQIKITNTLTESSNDNDINITNEYQSRWGMWKIALNKSGNEIAHLVYSVNPITTYTTREGRDPENYINIEMIHTDDKYQRMGYASKLLKELLNIKADKFPDKQIIATGNIQSRDLLRKFGILNLS